MNCKNSDVSDAHSSVHASLACRSLQQSQFQLQISHVQLSQPNAVSVEPQKCGLWSSLFSRHTDILKHETAVKLRLHVLILKMKLNLRMKVNTTGH